MRLLWVGLLAMGMTAWAADPTPLLRAHAHNDYEHARPLFDALDRGFANIEADIYLIEGRLLVAHDRKDVKPERTLESLYLDPLRARVKQNGGRVYRGGPTITLLVDVKTEAAPTYAALHVVLERYAEMLTEFRGRRIDERAILVIVSGNRATAEIDRQPVRWAAVDGRRGDFETNPSPALVPWISENWKTAFTWNWQGEMPEEQRAALARWVERAHAQGRKVRFWNTPDRPDAWTILLAAGVDVIGTDDLAGLSRFLAARSR